MLVAAEPRVSVSHDVLIEHMRESAGWQMYETALRNRLAIEERVLLTGPRVNDLRQVDYLCGKVAALRFALELPTELSQSEGE